MTHTQVSVDQYPLPAQQRRLFALDMLGSSTAYNFPLVYAIDGDVRADRLAAAFEAVVAARAVYRSGFMMQDDGQPALRIQDHVPFALEVREAHGASVQEMVRDFVRPFDLGKAPLLRARLVNVAPGSAVLLIDMHHIVTDLHSVDLLLEDLAHAYEGKPLAPEPLPFRDYMADFSSHEASPEDIEAQGHFWQTLFAGELTVAKLPTDFERPVLQNFKGARERFLIDEAQLAKVHALCERLAVDERTFFMACYHIFLAKSCGEEDVVAGCIHPGRRTPALEKLQSMFVKTQAIRSQPKADTPFDLFAKGLHDTLAQAHVNADYGIERLIEHLQVPRDASRTPLFDAMFLLKPKGYGALRLGACQVAAQSFESGLSKFDMTLILEHGKAGLAAALEYNTTLFERGTIERFVHQFQTLLTHVLAQPNAAIGALALISEAEMDAIWARSKNDTPHASDALMHTLFHRAAAEHPQDIAVASPRGDWSYGALSGFVNRLASEIQDAGAAVNDCVAVIMDPGWEQAAATLAAQTAGTAYVPINPTLPRSRILHLLERCAIRVILTQPWHAGLIDWPSDAAVIEVDGARSGAAQSDAPHPAYQAPDDIAYTIFTSGTTGTPKGVVMTHRAVVNTLLDINRRYGIGRQDKVLALSALNFDLSVYDIFGMLAAGGTVVYPDHEQAKSPPHWHELVLAHGVTLWNTVPALLGLLCEHAARQPDAPLLPLRCVMMSGDWIPVNLPQQVRALCEPGLSVNSLGGATEAAIWSITYPINDLPDGVKRIPYGRPLDNQSFFVLDSALNPCPVGVTGDLFIGGIGLAREYWGDPDKTNASFFVHPSRGERIYRTGDMGRYLPDGCIDIVGRRDHQVKINGYRIELEEIESFLLRFPGIRQAAVAVHRHESAQVLCAYVVAEQPASDVVCAQGDPHSLDRDIMDFLSESLPEYMVPLHYVWLDELPLSANDKVDRAALPKPQMAERTNAFVAARTPVEAALVEIWQAVLRQESIGVHDSFFRLGGDSIKAIQIASRLRERGFGLRVDDLFRYGTISELAPHLKTATLIDQEQVVGRVEMFPVGHWFMALNLSDPHHWNQDVLIRHPGRFDAQAVRKTLGALFAQHDLLRARLAPDGQALEIAAMDQFQWCLEEHDLFGVHDAAARMADECNRVQASIDWLAGPLVKAVLFKGAVSDDLLIVAHHLLVDGVSWRVLVEDFQTAYQQTESGAPVKLPAKTHSAKRWAQALTRYAGSAPLLGELPHWQATCAGSQAPTKEGRALVGEALTHVLALDAEETGRLLRDVHRAYNTEINDVLLSALCWALGGQSDEGSILIQMEGHGREDIEDGVDISRTVGWFTTVYPVRLPIGHGDWPSAIRATKETLRQTPRKGIGFGVLKYTAALPADQAQALAYEPMLNFNYLGELGGAAQDGALRYSFSAGGARRSPRSEMLCPLDIQCLVTDGVMQVKLVHDPVTWPQAVVQGIGQAFMAGLRELIAHCTSRTDSTYTPSDFELAQVDQGELDQLLRTY